MTTKGTHGVDDTLLFDLSLRDAAVTMTTVSIADSRDDGDGDHLTAELAIAVYQVALRETTPQNWLELQLDLWDVIRVLLSPTQVAQGRVESQHGQILRVTQERPQT